jgi:hypothetical protein
VTVPTGPIERHLLVDKVEKFKKAFGPRVKNLNLDQMSVAPSTYGAPL